MLFLQIISQLAYCGGFTGALQTYQHNNGRWFGSHRQFFLRTAQQVCQFFIDDLDDLLTGA